MPFDPHHQDSGPSGGDRRRLARGLRAWFGRIGVVGFGFFLIKGLLWLAIPWLLARRLVD